MDKLTNYINIVSKATRQAQQDAAFVNLLNQEIEEFMAQDKYGQQCWNAGYAQGVEETVEKILQMLETFKVKEDGRHQWREDHNYCIDKCKLKLAKYFDKEN